VAGEPKPLIDIHKDVSRLFCFVLFFYSFDETMTEIGLNAEGPTEVVLHLNLGIYYYYYYPLSVSLMPV
jgi:hypothetical protein